MTGDFAAEFRLRRRQAGLTQAELARRSGIGVRTLRDIERGQVRAPHEATLARLTQALDGCATRRPPAGTTVDTDPGPAVCAAVGPAPAFEVDVLGPLAVRVAGRPVRLRGAAERGLLGLLALHGGRPVSRDEIIATLWGDHPPKTSVTQVQTAVGRLRRLVDPARRRWSDAGPLRHARGSYLLALPAGGTDLHRFDTLLAEAQQADDAALDVLDRALCCWRGPVLQGESPRLHAHPAAAAAERRRLTAIQRHAELAAALGRHGDALRHLTVACQSEPYHEGLHAGLILALAGSGAGPRPCGASPSCAAGSPTSSGSSRASRCRRRAGASCAARRAAPPGPTPGRAHASV